MTTNEARPSFIGSHVESVTCHFCDDEIAPEDAHGIDLSLPHALYPDMKPVCARCSAGSSE